MPNPQDKSTHQNLACPAAKMLTRLCYNQGRGSHQHARWKPHKQSQKCIYLMTQANTEGRSGQLFMTVALADHCHGDCCSKQTISFKRYIICWFWMTYQPAFLASSLTAGVKWTTQRCGTTGSRVVFSHDTNAQGWHWKVNGPWQRQNGLFQIFGGGRTFWRWLRGGIAWSMVARCRQPSTVFQYI